MRKTPMGGVVFAALALVALLIAGSDGQVQEAEPHMVGSETCQACHADKYQSFIQSNHGNKLDPGMPAGEYGCETCHGPGSAHVESGGGLGVGIFPLDRKSLTPAAKKNAVCLDCHTRGDAALWHGSTHDSRGLSCSTCHSIHSGNPKNLRVLSQTDLCTECHKSVKADLLRPSHHPLREGKMECSDCHNTHGSVGDKLIRDINVNQKCYECHAEKRGPFLWEHAPVTEDCITCHRPHGSSQQKLLAGKEPYLCQKCHSNSRHPGTLYTLDAASPGSVYSNTRPSQRGIYRACRNCHVQIHGSNHPSGKGLVR